MRERGEIRDEEEEMTNSGEGRAGIRLQRNFSLNEKGGETLSAVQSVAFLSQTVRLELELLLQSSTDTSEM